MVDPKLVESSQKFAQSITNLLLETPAKDALLKMTGPERVELAKRLGAVLGEHPALELLDQATTTILQQHETIKKQHETIIHYQETVIQHQETISRYQDTISDLEDRKIEKLEKKAQAYHILREETITAQQTLVNLQKQVEDEERELQELRQ
ncbi:hypothetical protein LTR56_001649 [Elasticomyces elasticus]|nr:hypothetical protein LTR56_001649 [Elasticomyces elasticus]KAK3667299.1 hypothetical protein LTR22_001815 [Elasticomyces elasticus]KAK4932621.1 hypothetical protein LTR49_001045 [Elasticomyces elasticus]KAK5769643.1 hypothetical protein LTS12_000093 [Elasticomyces elasticus]